MYKTLLAATPANIVVLMLYCRWATSLLLSMFHKRFVCAFSPVFVLLLAYGRSPLRLLLVLYCNCVSLSSFEI